MAAVAKKMSEPVVNAMETFNKKTDEVSNQIDNFLEEHSTVGYYVKSVEYSTGISIKKFLLGVVFVPLVWFFIPALLMAFTLTYPSYLSVTSIEKGKVDRTRWLIYWVFHHTIKMIDASWFGYFLHLIPGFILLRFIFFLWCMAPVERNGCVVVYRLIRPIITKYIGLVDDKVNAVSGQIGQVFHDNKGRILDATVAVAAATNQKY